MNLNYFILWYMVGLVLMAISYHANRDRAYNTVGEAIVYLLMALLGPLWLLYVIYYNVHKAVLLNRLKEVGSLVFIYFVDRKRLSIFLNEHLLIEVEGIDKIYSLITSAKKYQNVTVYALKKYRKIDKLEDLLEVKDYAIIR